MPRPRNYGTGRKTPLLCSEETSSRSCSIHVGSIAHECGLREGQPSVTLGRGPGSVWGGRGVDKLIVCEMMYSTAGPHLFPAKLERLTPNLLRASSSIAWVDHASVVSFHDQTGAYLQTLLELLLMNITTFREWYPRSERQRRHTPCGGGAC